MEHGFWFASLSAVGLVTSFSSTLMFTALGSFFNRISDPGNAKRLRLELVHSTCFPQFLLKSPVMVSPSLALWWGRVQCYVSFDTGGSNAAAASSDRVNC